MSSYNDEFLLNELKRFYKENNRSPYEQDMCPVNGYPSFKTFIAHFGSWNKSLINAGLPLNRFKHDKNTKCYICGSSTITKSWCYDKDKNIICDRCAKGRRDFVEGVLDPNCETGIGIITEHIVYEVLGDCVKCNTIDNFNLSDDLISNKYGTINVKSSKLQFNINRYLWHFGKSLGSPISDYYICLGFNENRTEIQHVWIIPGNSNVVSKSGITVSQNNLQRVTLYEVDPNPYNDLYQNLDITTLPEFRNLNNKKLIQECDIL